jgi:hypothetical protein
VPLPDFTEAEYGVYFDEHLAVNKDADGDLRPMSPRFRDFELTIVSPERMEISFDSMSVEGYIGGPDIPAFKGLDIVHRWYEPMCTYIGFRHWFQGKIIAEGNWSDYENDGVDHPEQGFCPLLAYCNPTESFLRCQEVRAEDEFLAMFSDETELNEYRDLPEIDRLRALKTNVAKISEAKKI